MKARHIIIVIIFLLINVIVIGALIPKGVEEEKEKTVVPIQTLAGMKVENADETFAITGYGTVSSYNTVDVSAETQGKLIEGKHPLKPGTSFRRGDLLFRINDTDAQYNLRARKSAFITLIATFLPDMRIDFPKEYDKWENYFEKIKLNENLPQLPSWGSKKEKVFLSTRNVLTEYFTIKSMEEQMKKYRFVAPYSGTITQSFMAANAVVNPGTPIIRIVETERFEIPVSISAEDAEYVEMNAPVSIFNSTGTLKGKGTVIRVSEVISAATQSINVYVRPEAVEGKAFTEGEYVKVQIDRPLTHHGVRLPASAVTEENTVYTFSKKDSTLSPMPINISDDNEQGIFVKGIPDGTMIITQEVLNYSDSSKYQILIR